MPESKKRVKKRVKSYTPPAAVKGEPVAKKKKPLNKQQIAIYVISILVILSMAVGFLVGNGRGRSAVTPTASSQQVVTKTPQAGTPAPNGTAAATPAPTSAGSSK